MSIWAGPLLGSWKLDLISILNVLTFAALFSVGIVPIYLVLKIKVRPLRLLSLFLGLFAIIHGLYHLADAYGQSFLADVVLEPASVAFLLAFGLYYSKKGIS